MKARYKHTNLIAKDWQRLARFYEDVFGCVRVPPERHLSGEWLEKGTAVKGARFSGVHLALPGCQGHTPTLEIYEYSHNEKKPSPAANREGFGHIAFEVEDVATALDIVQQHGGQSPRGNRLPRSIRRRSPDLCLRRRSGRQHHRTAKLEADR